MSEEIVLGDVFLGKDKRDFLESMEKLWYLFEREGLENIRGFECISGEPVYIKKILRKNIIREVSENE